MTAHVAKRTGFFLSLAALSITQLVAVAHGAPVPNLVLTCSDENAISQSQSACDVIWAYQIPTDPLIVSSGKSYVWRLFGDLTSTVIGSVSGLHVYITDASVEGSVGAHRTATFDGMTVHGGVGVSGDRRIAQVTITRSYIDSPSTAAALQLSSANVTLEQTFVRGAQAVAVGERDVLQSSSSVLAGPVSGSAGAVLSCTETYGADYELLDASCQP